ARPGEDFTLPEPPTGVVDLRGLDSPEPEASEEPASALAEGCGRIVQMLRDLSQRGGKKPPRLWLVTSGSQAVGDEPVALSQAPLWGMGKVIPYEYPELACTRVDLGPERSHDEVRALCAELLARDREDEIALRGSSRHVARLRRHAVERRPKAALR